MEERLHGSMFDLQVREADGQTLMNALPAIDSLLGVDSPPAGARSNE
jgi:hypothetical protein